MSRGKVDIRVLVNREIATIVHEIDEFVMGYELIPENLVISSTGYAALARDKPISLHSVGVYPNSGWRKSVGVFKAAEQMFRNNDIDIISIHLANDTLGGLPADRLIPIPSSEHSIDAVAGHIRAIQDYLGRVVLIENIAEYYSDPDSDMYTLDFVAKVCRKAQCAILFDINNHVVNECNFGGRVNLKNHLDLSSIRELHVAGHIEVDGVAVDAHSSDISDECLSILSDLSGSIDSPLTVVLERDTNVFGAATILSEIRRIENALSTTRN